VRDEAHERHAVATGVRDALDVDDDDRARADPDRREPLGESREALVVDENRLGVAVEAHDARRALEGAEHHDDAAVLAEVRDGLDAAAGLVEVGDAARTEDGELAAVALRRAVDVAVRVERRRRHEEDRLGLDEAGEPLVDLVVDPAHRTTLLRSVS
jgi:hypothetical protein